MEIAQTQVLLFVLEMYAVVVKPMHNVKQPIQQHPIVMLEQDNAMHALPLLVVLMMLDLFV